MRAAAWQFDVTGDVARNLNAVERGLRRAAGEGVELVVLPEMWPSSFPGSGEDPRARLTTEAEAVAALRELSSELGLCVAGSSLAGSPGDLRNRLQLFDAGRELLVYDKVHLFSPTAEPEVFAAGDEPPPTVAACGAHISGAVCYDLRFAEIFRFAARAGVEVLVLPAQWPVPRATHWRALVVARAIEAQCFVVACNRTGFGVIGRRELRLEFPGNSLVVSPHGEVLAEGRGEEGLVAADLDLEAVRRYRTRVPVDKDERPDLYRRW